jgi:hypothetical protein
VLKVNPSEVAHPVNNARVGGKPERIASVSARPHKGNRLTPPPEDDHSGNSFFKFLSQELTISEQVGVVKVHRPDWSLSQIAAVLNVSPQTVRRTESWKNLRLLDLSRTVRGAKTQGKRGRRLNPPHEDRGFSNPDRPRPE